MSLSSVKCEICGVMFSEITWSHLKYSHGITSTEYLSRFPDAVLVPLDLLNIIRSLGISVW